MKGFTGYAKSSNIPQLDREMPLITNKNLHMEGRDFLQNVQTPQEMKRVRTQQARKKYDQLLEKVQFFEHDQFQRTYIYEKGIEPYIYFFKALARKPEGTEKQIKSTINRLKIWIPDTIVIGDNDLPPMWFYSSPEGYVFRTDNFTKRHISAKLSNYASPDELVGVLKKPALYDDGEICGNEIKMTSARDIHQATANVFQEQVGIQVIQKFVKSNGPKAFICRTVWRKNQNAYAWIITNKNGFYPNDSIPNYSTQNKGGPGGQAASDTQKYIVQPRNMGSCTIVNTCRGKYVDETVPYINNILRYLEIQIGLRFKEFIADFIKDESGIWWMINVKGFKLEDEKIEINLKPITHFGDITFEGKEISNEKQDKYAHTKMKDCKYCERNLPVTELNHKMTLKMIIQTDRHLLHRSKGQQYEWLKRSDINNLDSALLYQEHKVCIYCYKIYSEVERLIKSEYEFAQKLGIPCGEETKYALLNLKMDGQEDDEECIGYKDMYGGVYNSPQVPPSWQMDIRDNGRLIMQNNQPRVQYQVEKKLYRYRLILMLESLRQIPENIDFQKQYFIQYEMFGQTVKYRLDFSDFEVNKKDSSKININLDKIRVFYFFAKGQKLTTEDDEFLKRQKKTNQPEKRQKNTENDEDEQDDDRGRKAVNRYMNIKEKIQIKLLTDYEEIAVINLELQDLVTETESKKEFLKFFCFKDQNEYFKLASLKDKQIPKLTWGLNLMVGLNSGGLQDVTRVVLDDSDGIFLPQKDYYSCDPLPQEWIQMFKDRPDPMSSSRKKQFNNSLTTKWSQNISQNLSKKMGYQNSPMSSSRKKMNQSQSSVNLNRQQQNTSNFNSAKRKNSGSQAFQYQSVGNNQQQQQQQQPFYGNSEYDQQSEQRSPLMQQNYPQLQSPNPSVQRSRVQSQNDSFVENQNNTKKEVKFAYDQPDRKENSSSQSQFQQQQQQEKEKVNENSTFFGNNTTMLPNRTGGEQESVDDELEEKSTLKNLLLKDLLVYDNDNENENKKKIKRKIYY